MGRLLAIALAKRGAQVELFDKGGPDASHAAARIAAAMLAPLAESAITEDAVVRMGIYSLPRWKSLIKDLSTPVYFQQDGTLILWHRQDASEAERFAAHLEKNCLNNVALHAPQTLDNQALRNLEPGVADRFNQGLYLPNEGQLDNRQLLDALAFELANSSVNCHWHCETNPELVRSLESYDQVIDCRGVGAQSTWNKTRAALRGVRGLGCACLIPGRRVCGGVVQGLSPCISIRSLSLLVCGCDPRIMKVGVASDCLPEVSSAARTGLSMKTPSEAWGVCAVGTFLPSESRSRTHRAPAQALQVRPLRQFPI